MRLTWPKIAPNIEIGHTYFLKIYTNIWGLGIGWGGGVRLPDQYQKCF